MLSRQVAVKVLRETADDETDRLRFTAEARTLAGLNHVGLVMVLDAGITAEQPFLVMELVEGPTLAQLCCRGPLDAERVARHRRADGRRARLRPRRRASSTAT